MKMKRSFFNLALFATGKHKGKRNQSSSPHSQREYIVIIMLYPLTKSDALYHLTHLSLLSLYAASVMLSSAGLYCSL